MHGEFFLLESGIGTTRRATRLPLGETRGRDEAWLRDTLFANPELLPVADVDPSYAPLIPLCTELRTSAGPVDIAFINPMGRLTLVECKLWRNTEARRKVVAQVLDYARALRSWTYSDLQRQVSAASGFKGNIPFERARAAQPQLQEHDFIDNVSRSLRDGRFLLLIAGDGIREDVGAIAELINRNVTSGFSFGQVEVALYEFPDGSLAVQPRAITRTKLIERQIIISDGQMQLVEAEDNEEISEEPVVRRRAPAPSGTREIEEAWWAPICAMKFDDPDQDPPLYRWRNHVKAHLPIPGLWLTAYTTSTGQVGVFLSGRSSSVVEAMRLLPDETLNELPLGSYRRDNEKGVPFFGIQRRAEDFASDDALRQWLSTTLNLFVNAIRPRL